MLGFEDKEDELEYLNIEYEIWERDLKKFLKNYVIILGYDKQILFLKYSMNGGKWF